ncbi:MULTISPECIES: oxidoreductase [unclassified Micromonospora]|uniref:oxidoreductase n=1 Tax=unclassified Micromonospora TaxID=2617518 RepID=UPI001F33210B|nr:oxidoreductase [Verrucosispora sp. SN26_14.1]
MTEAAARAAVARWLRLVQADTELSAYLIGVDLDRLAAHLIRQLVGGGPVLEGWPGLPEAPRRRVGDYLAGALATGGPAVIDEVAAEFRASLAGHCPLPASELALVVAALARLVGGGGGGRAERWALLAVLGRVHHRHRLRPEHGPLIGAALATVAPRLCPPPVDVGWERRWRRSWALVVRAAGRMGDGSAFWSAEVTGRDLSAEGIAILAVRPWHPLPFRPGQAVPLCLPQHPGRWRWYCPANAPRPDGTVELHVRAVAAGTGLAPLRALVEQVAAAPAGRRVTLIVGVRTVADLYDAIALDKLDQAHPWLTVVPVFSHDPLAVPEENGDALTVALGHLRSDQEVYVCGPPAMLAGSRLRLLAAAVPAERIHLPGLVG